jgi:hypothetical protein
MYFVCQFCVINFIFFLIKHEDYILGGSETAINDIALITLERNVEFKENIQPACLPSKNSNRPVVGSKAAIAGWGRTKDGDESSLPNLLQNVMVNIYEPKSCRLSNGDAKICLGTFKKSTAFFTRLSPLFFRFKSVDSKARNFDFLGKGQKREKFFFPDMTIQVESPV